MSNGRCIHCERSELEDEALNGFFLDHLVTGSERPICNSKNARPNNQAAVLKDCYEKRTRGAISKIFPPQDMVPLITVCRFVCFTDAVTDKYGQRILIIGPLQYSDAFSPHEVIAFLTVTDSIISVLNRVSSRAHESCRLIKDNASIGAAPKTPMVQKTPCQLSPIM